MVIQGLRQRRSYWEFMVVRGVLGLLWLQFYEIQASFGTNKINASEKLSSTSFQFDDFVKSTLKSAFIRIQYSVWRNAAKKSISVLSL